LWTINDVIQECRKPGKTIAKPSGACPRLVMADRHCRGHARNERYAGRDIGDPDADRHALRQPHPSVDRIDAGQALGARRGVRDTDAAGHGLDAPDDRITIAHQRRFRAVANADMGHLGLLEIAVDPIAVGIDHGDVGRAGVGKIADPQQQIGDIAIHRTAHLRALEVDVGPSDLLLCGVEDRLRLDGVADE